MAMYTNNGLCAAALAMCVSLSGCVDEVDDQETSQSQQDITAAAGGVVSQEFISINTGTYREVARLISTTNAGCTGTVIGPYAVLTARHCYAVGTAGMVQWPGSGISLPYVSNHTNPYATQPFWPTWWRQLNQAQVNAGIRLNDWPAQHDLGVLFVAGLTPEFIATRLRLANWKPGKIDAHAPVSQMTVVGNSTSFTGTSASRWRQSANVSFDPAVQGDISTFNLPLNQGGKCQANRDGYYSIASPISTNAGDSGGPVLGATFDSWATSTIESQRHVIAVNSNACGDEAPLAYDSGLALTPGQDITVRLNQLWARAVASDADADLLPFECDSDPANSIGSTNRCPDPVGGPPDNTIPRGLLQCRPGFVATGIKGNAGWLIDKLAVQCKPISCLELNRSSCRQAYWTDSFAGDSAAMSANTFEATCPNNAVMRSFTGRHSAGTLVREISPVCERFSDVRAYGSSWAKTSLGTVGNVNGALNIGATYSRQCSSHAVLAGFEARSNHTSATDSLQYITGLQPICVDVSGYRPHAGGTGGSAEQIMCPSGFVTVGVRTSLNASNSVVGMFGLLCAERSRVEAGLSVSTSNLVIAHGGYAQTATNRYPAMVEQYQTFIQRAPSTTSSSMQCPNGHAVSRVSFRAGSLVDQTRYVRCTNIHSDSYATYDVYAGGSGGSIKTQACSSGTYVNGMLMHSGWLTDGVSLHCK